jgi:pyruvate kinase
VQSARELYSFSRAFAMGRESVSLFFSERNSAYTATQPSDVIERLVSISGGSIRPIATDSLSAEKRFYTADFHIRSMVDAISHSTCGMSIDINAKAIVVCSLSGMTARMVSRFRSPVPIIGLTTNERTWRKLALSWGVTPAMCEQFTSTDVLFYTAKNIATKELSLSKGDRIVITGGDTMGHSGNTNLIKIVEV